MREHKGTSIIAFPTEYIVIDIETTGLDYDFCEIIEVSALKCSAGQVIDKYVSLVKPEPLCYDYDANNNKFIRYVGDFITELTGITNEMLKDAPAPEIVVPELLDFIGDALLVAHNANFDINFIYDYSQKICNTPLCNDFIDTMRIARKFFPELKHHRLKDIALACNVSQTESHRAESDCLTTSQCFEFMRTGILKETSLEDFQKLFKKKHKKYKDTLSHISATVEDIDDTNPLYGKTVVFTGALSSMERKEAFQIVANLGAIPQNSISKKTNYLVVGDSDFAKSVKDGKTTKMKQAEAYMKKGCEIFLLSEKCFFDMISDYI